MYFCLYFFYIYAVVIAEIMNAIGELQKSSILFNIKNETVLNKNYRVKRNNGYLSPHFHMSSKFREKEPYINHNADINSENDKYKFAYISKINHANPFMYSSQSINKHNSNLSVPARSVADNNYGSITGANPFSSYRLNSFPTSLYELGSNLYGYLGSKELPRSLETYDSSSDSFIPASCSSYTPHHGEMSIAQQIIHKPIITELQEIIHKPIIIEEQEIVNKPIISEIQQVIHKPLYTEHIGLKPSYYSHQKHVVKQPIYQKSIKHFIHQPISHAETINLPDEYEHACTTNNAYNIFGPNSDSLYRLSEVSYSTLNKLGIDNTQQKEKNAESYKTGYLSITPIKSFTMQSSPVLYRYSTSASIGHSNLNTYKYSPVPLYRYTSKLGNEQKTAIVNTNNKESFRNIKIILKPQITEQIMNDEFLPYKQPLNHNNQQGYNNEFLKFKRNKKRNSEDTINKFMDVNGIAKQVKKNSEIKKQLMKIIADNTYIGDQMT